MTQFTEDYPEYAAAGQQIATARAAAARTRSCPYPPRPVASSARLHPNASIEPDTFAVQVIIFGNEHRQVGDFGRLA